MTAEAEFNRLRQTCSATLELFIAAARQTERGMQQLSLPVSGAASRQFVSQCSTEAEACEQYLVATTRLRDFLQKHVYTIN